MTPPSLAATTVHGLAATTQGLLRRRFAFRAIALAEIPWRLAEAGHNVQGKGLSAWLIRRMDAPT